MQGVDPRLAQAIAYARALYAVPRVHSVVDSLTLLSGASAAYWILSRLLGRLAAGLHERLDRSLADLFAVAYNVVLASLYAAVMASAVIHRVAEGGLALVDKAAGFLFVYVTLRLTYSDRHGEVDEYGLLGYGAGVAVYILLILRPAYLAHPALEQAYYVVLAVMETHVARLLTAAAVVRAVFGFARWVARGILSLFRRPDADAVA